MPGEALNIAVIGAGIVGVSSAEWLRRDGHNVTIIDRLPPGEGTSFGNGGVLARCGVVPVPTPGILRSSCPRFRLVCIWTDYRLFCLGG